jgi:hypothetical protein
MTVRNRRLFSYLFVTFYALTLGPLHAQTSQLTWQQKEEFLRTAKVVSAKENAKGITQTLRVMLSDGKLTHEASVQRIDEHKAVFQVAGASEVNFKDSYRFNIAAWKLALMLGLDDMMPPSVERRYSGSGAAFTWWIDDVMMEEGDRLRQKMQPPDSDSWRREVSVMQVFDQLIYNTDRNQGNMQIDKQWHLWMIDHTRSFRMLKTLKDPGMLVSCDRNLLAKMKALDEATLKKELKNLANDSEIKGLLARRDLIVNYFESKGDAALMNRPSRS